MLARPYQTEDLNGIDALLENNQHGDARLSHDQILVTGPVGRPTGVLVFRPGAYVHELRCGQGLLRRARADALVGAAFRWALGHGSPSGIFLVKPQNEVILRYMKSIGAVQQSDPGDLLFTVRV
jgi:hypothetical protein